jgi:cell division protein FtsW
MVNFDKHLIGTIGFLLVFGLIMVFSSTIHIDRSFFDLYYIKQFVYLLIALILSFIVLKTPIAVIKHYSPILFIINLILLVFVFIPVIGGEVKGSYRWIHLVFFNFQPSEMLKLVIILFMAGFVMRQEKHVKNSWVGLIKTIGILFIVGLLLLLETDLGAFLVISITALTILFIANVEIKRFLLLAFLGLGSAVIVAYKLRLSRITAFLNPWKDPFGESYQLIQSMIGIGRGEWFGTGIGSGIQKSSFLPDAHTDFIFSVIGEELGVLGMMIVLCSFTFIIFKTFVISKTAKNQGKLYSSFVAFGIAIWLFLQVFTNIGVNTGLLPTTGLTLPLFSYGGSSLIMSAITFAILLRIDFENRDEYRQH